MITGLKLDGYGVHELLNSTEIQRRLKKEAEAINRRAGGGYKVTVQPGINRAHGRVSTITKEEFYKELRSNRLIRSM